MSKITEIYPAPLVSRVFSRDSCETGGPSNWFAVYTTARHEKQVARHLEAREVQSFLPSYYTTHLWRNGLKARLELPLFPNYIFVRINPREHVKVLATPGVISVIGSRRAPTPLPEEVIETLRSGLHLVKCEPHQYLTIGERVRIHGGPLAGMQGVLLRKKGDLRVVITLDAIMQSVAVEVDTDQVDPVRPIPLTLHA